MSKTKRFILQEDQLPRQWYNIVADMKVKPMPMLHPGTKQPLKEEDLYPIFSKEASHLELNQTDRYIDIPEPVSKLSESAALADAYGPDMYRHAGCHAERLVE